MTNPERDSVDIREVVEGSLRLVLAPGSDLPADNEDWIESGLVDSMAHVEFLLSVERAFGVANLFNKSGCRAPQTMGAAVDAVQNFFARQVSIAATESPEKHSAPASVSGGRARIVGWGAALGSQCIAIECVEREFDLAAGTLRERAGIESVRRAAADEDEISLASAASRIALKRASAPVRNIDWIIGTSGTFQGLPSFAASLHTSLLAPSTCRTLDVGGGCVGLLNSLIVANSLLADPAVNQILVTSADVHSRILIPERISGEFGGLFGDGASAFVLVKSANGESGAPFAIRASAGSCAGTFSSALQIRPGMNGAIALTFDGESLAHAALEVLESTIGEMEMRTGKARESASAFAIHQPNQRLVEILIRRAKLSAEKVFLVTKTCGNLGTSTCGVALSTALDAVAQTQNADRGPIFMAAVGPGLLSAGIVLD
jgi:3-oxoacyl-[acyl-carrier-protein] synthase III